MESVYKGKYVKIIYNLGGLERFIKGRFVSEDEHTYTIETKYGLPFSTGKGTVVLIKVISGGNL